MEEKKTITIEELRKALLKVAWNVNATKKDVKPLLVVYPNDLLLELFGDEELKKSWISDEEKSQKTRLGAVLFKNLVF